MTPAEISTLAQRYHDPATGLYNYLQFHTDIERLGGGGEGEGGGPPTPLSAPVRTEILYTTVPKPGGREWWSMYLRCHSNPNSNAKNFLIWKVNINLDVDY